jgi:hypothetical protein
MLQKLSFHIIFWLISLNLCAFIIGYQSDWESAYLLTLIYGPVPIASAYFIDSILIEGYLLKKKYVRFTLYLVYVMIISMFLVMVNNTIIFITVAKYQYGLMPAATKDSIVLLSTLYLLVFLFVSTQSVKKYSLVYAEKEAALKSKAETELKFLKSQLNPHFLFNTLNNLYSLALQKSDQAPEAILKLSQLLDSVLNTNKATLISIDEELNTLTDYIYLETLRYGNRLDILKVIDIDQRASIKVPPLCLIVLMENCFKHGTMPHGEITKIVFTIHRDNEHLIVCTSNAVKKEPSKNSQNIGLENIEKQLHYLYSANYELKTETHNGQFKVSMKLPI